MSKVSENIVIEPGGTVTMSFVKSNAVDVSNFVPNAGLCPSDSIEADVLESFLRDPSSRESDVVTAIKQAAFLLWDTPSRLQNFWSRSPDGFRVVCAYSRPNDSDEDVLDLIIVITPSQEGRIFTYRSHESESSLLQNTLELRAVMSPSEVWNGFGALTRRWASGIAELLQLELLNHESADSHRLNCLKRLRELCREYGVLPPSFYLHDLDKEGNHPISGGGFSDIWKGYINSVPVCIKVLRMFTTGVQAQLFKKFSNEALVWKQLDHPNVLPFLGVNTELFPRFCLVSPWMENGNVNTFLENNPDHDRLTMLVEIAQGLKYLHNLNPQIIHGDIRGANIMVDPSKVCRLADFGLALVTESRMTTSTGMQGTLRWMAPEAVFSSSAQEKIPPSLDIYAFGCTMLEIFTGKPPFANMTDGEVIAKIYQGSRPSRPVESIVPISDELWNIIEECWVVQPAFRPDATKALMALKRLQSGQLIAEPGPPTLMLSDDLTVDSRLHGADWFISELPFAEEGSPSGHHSFWLSNDRFSPVDSTSTFRARHHPAWHSKDSLSSVASSSAESHHILEPSRLPVDGTLGRNYTLWYSKDSLSSAASSVSGLSLFHSSLNVDPEPVLLTANTSFRIPTPNPPDNNDNDDCVVVHDTLNPVKTTWAGVDTRSLYASPECSVAHLESTGDEQQQELINETLGDGRLNNLMHGVSHGFDEPLAASVLSLQSLKSSRAIPQRISLCASNGDFRPYHIQAPTWQDLLHLLKSHPETTIDVNEVPKVEGDPNGVARGSESKLRVVCQFVKPPLAIQWRTVIWLTVDDPSPSQGYVQEQQERNDMDDFTRTCFPDPAYNRESNRDNSMQMHYAIPQTKELPYLSLPVALPDLGVYLEGVMEESRKKSNSRSKLTEGRRGRGRRSLSWSWNGRKRKQEKRYSDGDSGVGVGLEELARIVDCCQRGDDDALPRHGARTLTDLSQQRSNTALNKLQCAIRRGVSRLTLGGRGTEGGRSMTN